MSDPKREHEISGAMIRGEPVYYRPELLRKIATLELKNRSSLANNLCPDHRDKQADKHCLACEIERLEKELAEARKDTARLDWLFDWFGMHDDFEGSGVRDWNDNADARQAIDAATTSRQQDSE